MTLNLQEYYLDADHAALNLSATATAIGTVEWCEAQAHALNLTFAVQASSNGAPAGCAQYATKVVFVKRAPRTSIATRHLQRMHVAGRVGGHVRVRAPFLLQLPGRVPRARNHTPGRPNYSIGGNSNQEVYDTYSHGNGPSVFRIYVDECNFPPSPAAPPPIEGAMCEKGYWPL